MENGVFQQNQSAMTPDVVKSSQKFNFETSQIESLFKKFYLVKQNINDSKKFFHFVLNMNEYLILNFK